VCSLAVRLAWAAFATILAAPLVVRAGELPVRADVERLIVRTGADVAVAFRTLDGREELLIDPDVSFHAASTVKVPVMIELFRQSQSGLLKLDDRIPMTNTFRSVVDGSAYVLNPTEDSDTGMRHHLGKQVSYRELCEAMITASSNLAANIDLNKTLDQAQRLGGELDTAWRRKLLHAGRQMRSTADRGVCHPQIASNRAYHHLARVEPNSDLHAHAVAPPHFIGVALYRPLHAKRGEASSQRVVLVGEGSAEESHNTVASRLVHHAFEVMDRLDHPFQHRIEELLRDLGSRAAPLSP
jgi:hypothetical protein